VSCQRANLRRRERFSDRNRSNKIYFDGNGAKSIRRGDRLASHGAAGASGTLTCVHRAEMISELILQMDGLLP